MYNNCRAFTPQLATWYEKFKKTANGDKLEIIFVSSDRNLQAFDEYYAEMPWLALPYDNRDAKVCTDRGCVRDITTRKWVWHVEGKKGCVYL